MIRNQYIKDRLTLVNNSIKKVEKFKGNGELTSFLNSYLVVLISGVYEDCVEYLINERAVLAGDKEIATFIENTIDVTFRNPNYDNIIRILARFNKNWVKQMNKKIKNEAKESINSIVNNKNNIAHGGYSNLTLLEIKKCHKNCKSIFEKLEKII